MTRAEFVERNKEVSKNVDRGNKWFLVFLGFFAVFFFILDKFGNNVPAFIRGPILVLFGGMLGIAILLGTRATRRRRELGLLCPHCKKDFLGISYQFVVASGRCGHCGGVVLDDWNK
jgi:hypothetical protein